MIKNDNSESVILGSNLTPMMQQYLSIKSAHKEHLLFYRLGDFYELFFEDAKIASKALDIVLTRRGKQNNDDSIPMCGVPYHSIQHYMNKLLKNGYTIAICEQLESPEEAKKRGYKAVVKRDVVQIITAGTLMEEGVLENKGVNHLISIAKYKDEYAIACVELTTCEFFTINCQSKDLFTELSRLQPKEIIISEKDFEDFANIKQDWNFTIRTGNIFDLKACNGRLIKYYNIQSVRSLGEFSNAQIVASGGLVEYIIHTKKNNIPKLKNLKNIDRKFFMEIDFATRRSLELDTATCHDKKFSLLNIIDKTITSCGGRMLKMRLNSPLCNSLAINKRLKAVEFFYKNKKLSTDMRKYLVHFPDMERSLSKLFINKGTFDTLLSIRDGLKISTIISEIFRISDTSLIDEINSLVMQIYGFAGLLSTLEEALLDNKEDRFVKGGYNNHLDQLYDLKNTAEEKIILMKNKYAKDTDISNLKISRNNVLGYFVEISATNAKKLQNDNFIHKQTLGNSVRFYTNELKDLENTLLNCDDKILAIENEILDFLSTKVKSCFEEISLVIDSIANLDFYSSLAELAKEKNYTKPHIDDSLKFEITEGRHPVVENFQDKFVPNSCDISDNEKVWLITGPNMAGKSTFLRQNALICILAQMGSFVPATKVHIGVVDKIFSRLGASDNIAKGESTFMVEMIETAYITNNMTEKSFVILDEIGRGTSTYDGIAIAWAVLDYIQKINARTLFATHYHELTQLQDQYDSISTYTMQIKEWNNEIIFIYKLIAGIADSSYGVHVAQIAGLPKSVINTANKILEKLEKTHAIDKLENIENLKEEKKDNNQEESKIVEYLKNIDIYNLTPLDAQKTLAELVANAKNQQL
ncbi:MAG: DNA mismatch repair protein MutS [Candidatus Midichloriaceae bacterium]|jgi:DNA mismatch repair protein MutS